MIICSYFFLTIHLTTCIKHIKDNMRPTGCPVKDNTKEDINNIKSNESSFILNNNLNISLITFSNYQSKVIKF
jgi:hypothetical protein